ncbi:MAG: hypothetical protein ABR881_00555 [Candidatus Sulfotelmatobacter sp.]|jgi:hypothetical protein
MAIEPKTPAQIAAEAAEAARITAAQAAEANEIALLESITHIKDFSTKTNGNRFQADRLKSAYIKRRGFDAFQALCGSSR